jgi:predicted CoA-binding protein
VLLREFIKRGYEITPVNPASSFLEDRHCYARVGEITPPVEGVLVMTPPSVTEDVVRDCVDAGIKDVWLYRSVGQGSISPNAVSYCREHEINLIEGYCPMMFFRDAGLIHRIHRGFARLFGHFPREC